MPIEATHILVRHKDAAVCESQVQAVPPLAKDQVLMQIEEFALTANNVTYFLLGDLLGYWRFFPAPQGWGRVPVWGFARVVESNHPAVLVGDRYYGFWPMSSHLVIDADQVTEQGLRDNAEHRRSLPLFYNLYNRAGTANPTPDAIRSLIQPLFTTSFLISDLLNEHQHVGARDVLITAASSKTAFALGFMMAQQRAVGIRTIGLTSSGNREFVSSLGCYDKVLTYSEIESLDPATPTAVIDFAGSSTLRTQLHQHFAEQLTYDLMVGLAHAAPDLAAESLPGAKPQQFFAPARAEQRMREWGPALFASKVGQAWIPFREQAAAILSIQRVHGAAAVMAAWKSLVAGTVKPDFGLIGVVHP